MLKFPKFLFIPATKLTPCTIDPRGWRTNVTTWCHTWWSTTTCSLPTTTWPRCTEGRRSGLYTSPSRYHAIQPICGGIWVKSCRTGKKCLKCPKLTLTPRVAPAKPSILQTWVFYLVEDQDSAHLHKHFELPGTPGKLCRKGLKFPENPGNLNRWNCNIILI